MIASLVCFSCSTSPALPLSTDNCCRMSYTRESWDLGKSFIWLVPWTCHMLSSSHFRTQLLSICLDLGKSSRSSSPLCCITADDSMTWSRKAANCFPGDPHFGLTFNPTREHVEALEKKEMLNFCLLDNLLQRAAMPHNDSNTDRQICHHPGNFSVLEYFERTQILLYWPRAWKGRSDSRWGNTYTCSDPANTLQVPQGLPNG